MHNYFFLFFIKLSKVVQKIGGLVGITINRYNEPQLIKESVLTNNQTLRFIQTGDWHLFANHSEPGFQPRDERLRQCIQEIFSYSHDADFLILTGDLVDLRPMQADAERLAWLDEQLKSLGKNKAVITYGSHDDQSVRDWFSSRVAPRKYLKANIYTIECPSAISFSMPLIQN